MVCGVVDDPAKPSKALLLMGALHTVTGGLSAVALPCEATRHRPPAPAQEEHALEQF